MPGRIKKDPSSSGRAGQATAGREPESVNDYLLARALPALYVLDGEFRVLSYWLPADTEPSLIPSWKPPDGTLRLDAGVEETIRGMAAGWDGVPPQIGSSLAILVPAAVIRVMPLAGPGADAFAVTIERIKTRNAIDVARRRYALSPRELDVLALVLEGCDTPAVAVRLHIARSTANDHVKRMLAKTGSRNRAELVARVLGWSSR